MADTTLITVQMGSVRFEFEINCNPDLIEILTRTEDLQMALADNIKEALVDSACDIRERLEKSTITPRSQVPAQSVDTKETSPER